MLAASGKLHAIAVPKVSSPQMLLDVRKHLLQSLSSFSSSPKPPLKLNLWAMIETPLGVLNVREIAASASETDCTCLVAGTSDLTKDLRAQHTATRIPVLTSLSMLILAARAYSLHVLDGVHLALDDEEGFRLACEQGRELGFDGKTLIHPSQIDEANVTFGPSPQQIETAREIVRAWESAHMGSGDESSSSSSSSGSSSRSGGLVVVGKRLIESLHVEEATEVLAMADILAANEAESSTGKQ